MALGMAWAMRRCDSVVVSLDWVPMDSELGVAGVIFYLNYIVKLQSFSRCSTTLTCDKNAFGAQCAFALKSDCQV